MNTYLAIITTILVLTQIIRVAQNAINLSQRDKIEKQNQEVLAMWKHIETDVRDMFKFITTRWE